MVEMALRMAVHTMADSLLLVLLFIFAILCDGESSFFVFVFFVFCIKTTLFSLRYNMSSLVRFIKVADYFSILNHVVLFFLTLNMFFGVAHKNKKKIDITVNFSFLRKYIFVRTIIIFTVNNKRNKNENI